MSVLNDALPGSNHHIRIFIFLSVTMEEDCLGIKEDKEKKKKKTQQLYDNKARRKMERAFKYNIIWYNIQLLVIYSLVTGLIVCTPFPKYHYFIPFFPFISSLLTLTFLFFTAHSDKTPSLHPFPLSSPSLCTSVLQYYSAFKYFFVFFSFSLYKRPSVVLI